MKGWGPDPRYLDTSYLSLADILSFKDGTLIQIFPVSLLSHRYLNLCQIRSWKCLPCKYSNYFILTPNKDYILMNTFKSTIFLSTCLQGERSKLNQSSRTLSRASWGMLKIWKSMWVILSCCSLNSARLQGILTWHGSDENWFTSLKIHHYWNYASWGRQKGLMNMKPRPISLEAGVACTKNFKILSVN